MISTLTTADRQILNLKPVPFTKVRIEDAFWAPRREINRKVSLPHSLDMLEKAGNVKDFELAASGARSGFVGPVFMDSDLYKTLEAAAYTLATNPDPALDKRLDGMIHKMAKAQLSNGYLNTWYQVNEPDRHFTNLRDNHELYCAGHLFEAAAAHYQATGKKNLLNVATKYADHIGSLFGEGKRSGYCGHPEIELALIQLWRATGEKRYFDLARFFLEHRGEHFFAKEHGTKEEEYDGTYWQDDVPIRDHKHIKGHAVRAAYLLSGVTDLVMETRDAGMLKMLDRVWNNTTRKRMYVTGGIGPSASNEGFTVDYDLPNRSAYQETCASVAMAMWNHRMNLLYGDSRYADLVELALYNGILAGVSLDGLRFFYVNPLSSDGGHHRSEWFGCACCPPNVARTLARLGDYAYATSDDGLWVNLYIQGGVQTAFGAIDVRTEYPWDGAVKLTMHGGGTYGLHLRVPGWCQGAQLSVNGSAQTAPLENGYLVLRRAWRAGDQVDLILPMPAQRVEASPFVKENLGRLAVRRGPLIYCLEGCDQSVGMEQIFLPAGSPLTAVHRKDLLGGVTVLTGTASATSGGGWSNELYRGVQQPKSVEITMVPYYAWDNRKAGEMEVWIPTTPLPKPATAGLEGSAKVSVSFKNYNCQISGVNDGLEPKSSGEQPQELMHWWSHKGSEEWVRYDWPSPVRVSASRVYWFDDTGRGECRLPKSWRLEYLAGEDWKTVESPHFPIALNNWCEIAFPAVTTTAMRIVAQMQPNWAAGIHEWQVIPEEE